VLLFPVCSCNFHVCIHGFLVLFLCHYYLHSN
jgi:hypothetical protein